VVPHFLLSRLLLLVAALVGLRLFPLRPGDGPWPGSPTTDWLAALSRWDGKWYLAIARDGYAYHESAASSLNFAPGYPALMRLVGQAIGRTDNDGLLAVGIILSNLALLVALVCLYLLAREVDGQATAGRAVLWLVAFPSTLYLSAVYPESLFLALAISGFLFALRGRWALASVLIAGATLTRNYAVLLSVPLFWHYLVQHRWRPRRDIGWLLFVPFTFAVWQAYYWALTGDPLAMPHASAEWGRNLTAPWDMLRYYFSIKYWTAYVASGGAVTSDRSPIDILSVLLLGGLVALSWRLRPRSLGLLATVLYLPMISTGGFVAVPRYALEVFPIYLVLARLARPRWLLAASLAIAGGLALVAMGWFAVGGWLA
jgi:Mannosyltransferase (PIG-V)